MFGSLARKAFALLVLTACAGVVAAWCGDPDLLSVVKLPAPVSMSSGAVVDHHLYTVTDTGKLLKVSLKDRKVTDLGTPAEKLLPHIDVAGEKVLVAAPGKAHVIDGRTGKSMRAVPFSGATVHGLGLIDNRRAFVHTGPTVVILDLEAGTTLKTIDLDPAPAKEERRRSSPAACHRVGQRLYASSYSDKGLSIIDLENCKLLDQIKVPEWRIGSVSVVGDKATIIGLRYGYGVWTNSIAEIDLRTKKYTPKKLVVSAMRPCQIVRGPDNCILLNTDNQTFRYQADGTLTPAHAKQHAGHLLGVWNGSLLVAPRNPGNRILVLDLTTISTRATRR